MVGPGSGCYNTHATNTYHRGAPARSAMLTSPQCQGVLHASHLLLSSISTGGRHFYCMQSMQRADTERQAVLWIMNNEPALGAT